MPSSKFAYDLPPDAPNRVVKEEHIEYGFIGKLQNLKYEYRNDIRNRATLEKNFQEQFGALNRVKLTEAEFPGCWMKSPARMSAPQPRPCAASMPSPVDEHPTHTAAS